MSEIKSFVERLNFGEIKQKLSEYPYYLNVKEEDDKYMLCFTDKSDFTLPIVRQANGIILCKKTNKILHYCFEKCYNGIDNETKKWFQKIEIDDFINKSDLVSKQFFASQYIDGSLIKVFNPDGNKWLVATSRHINASKNFWTSTKSFLDLFEEIINERYNSDKFYEILRPEYCYTYLIKHPEIGKHNEKDIFLINMVNLETLEEDIFFGDKFEIEYDDLNTDENYILYIKNETNYTRVKLYNHSHNVKLFNPKIKDIGLRYICLQEDLKFDMKREFSEDIKKFKTIDNLLFTAAKNIQNFYFEIYVKRNFNLDIPQKYKMTISQLHQKFKETREYTTINTVKDHLLTLNPYTIANIIGYKYNK